jgi:hypothetical protein
LVLVIAFASTAQPQTWVEDTYKDFADGSFDDGGQNLYACRDGTVRTINRFDLNDDGHLDLIFNCTHDTYQMLPATVGAVTRDRQVTNRDLAFEGSLKVALGDLNRDGFTDVVCCPNGIGVHHDRRFVSIAWGGADGWPAHRINGALPINIAADVDIADLNNDGWPDIAVLGGQRWLPTHPPGRIIRVYWGGEDGFSVVDRTDIAVAAAMELASADFDLDGFRDLSVLRSDGKVTIVWTIGERTQVALPVANATCLIAGDADGDGRPDLIAGTGEDVVYLVAARPERDWKTAASIQAAPATNLAVGDLDGDKHPDLVLTEFSSARTAGAERAGAGERAQDRLRVLWGSEEGFANENSTLLEARHAVATAIGDLDGDGDADLAVAIHQGEHTFNGTSVVFLGNGKRGFRRLDGFRTSGTTDVAIAAADKNLPARAVFCNSIGGHLDEKVPLHVFWGGKGGFDPKRLWKIPFQSGYEASAADLNADGFVDLIALNSGHAHADAHDNSTLGANIFWGSRDGFDLKKKRTVIHEAFLGTSSVADLNRDGYLDLVLEPFAPEHPGEQDQLFLYYGGADGFDKSRRVAMESDGYSQEHLVADLNRDDWLDIVVTSRKLNAARIFWGSKDGFEQSREQRLKVSSPLGVDAADFNADGFLDLVIGSYNDPLSGYRDMGSLIFWGSELGYVHSNSQWLPGFSPLGRTIADFDSDGHLDLFSPQHSGERTREDLACHIYWGNKKGLATRRRTTLFSDSVNDSMAGDFNSDGLLDLAVNSHTRHGDHRTMSRVFYNDGKRFQKPKLQKLPTNGPHLMWAVDVGHIYDRSYRQLYESSVFVWDEAATEGKLEFTATISEGASLSFEIRAAARRNSLAFAEWRDIANAAFKLRETDRCLQYRAVFRSDNGDRYPTLGRVEIRLTE